MAKHSKWHNIRHKKAIQDAKKSKIYTKVAKLIEIAARGGADPKKNPALEMPLSKAKYFSVPKDVVEKALAKGSGNQNADQLQEMVYEGVGAGGVGLIIKAITPNRNRTAANLKVLLNKGGGSIGEPGSVLWQFSEKGRVLVAGTKKISVVKGNQIEETQPLQEEIFEEFLLSLSVSDRRFEEGLCEVFSEKSDFFALKNGLEAAGYVIEDAEIAFVPQS
ncbi:MAG TPA: YebC/PmpR family DNA-binding transcriptional regulator, partial [Candidatus Absconditabacterales bacterium]|nr:YebC/PmpR family DNA-binding transcriptional regulator [Candidatus Absconditabacterales bacterium]